MLNPFKHGIPVIVPVAFGLVCFVVACKPAAPDAKALSTYAQAKIVYESGNPAEAVKSLTALCRDWPDFKQAAFVRGRALYFTADYQGAGEVFRKLTLEHPQGIEAALWLVRCLQAQNQLAQARTLLEQLRELNPDDTRILWLLALQSEDENKPNEAMSFLQLAGNGDADMALVHLEIARISFQWGQLDKSRAEIKRTIAMLEEGSPIRDSALQLSARLKSGGKP